MPNVMPNLTRGHSRAFLYGRDIGRDLCNQFVFAWISCCWRRGFLFASRSGYKVIYCIEVKKFGHATLDEEVWVPGPLWVNICGSVLQYTSIRGCSSWPLICFSRFSS